MDNMMKVLGFTPNDVNLTQRIRSLPVFSAMPSGQLNRVLSIASLYSYDADEVIIAEGDTDERVFFVLRGTCVVTVEGLPVGVIDQEGEVFGEMGMADHKPRSATVIARENVICLTLDSSFLEHMEDVDALAAKALFYKIFSKILAQRIREANIRILELEKELGILSVPGRVLGL
jgi:CRP-like cAMP-binding protein